MDPTGKSMPFSVMPTQLFSFNDFGLTTHSQTMFTRNRLTRPFSGCELASNVASEDKSWPNKSFSPLVPGFDAAFQPFWALTTSSLVIDLRTCALGFLETFCLGFTGIYFAFRSHICDFIISMSCHQIQKRFVWPLFMLEEFFLGVSSCSQT